MEKYIVLVLLPEEPYIVYFCGKDKKGTPMFHEAVGLVKQIPLNEAEKVFDTINSNNGKILFCLMKWSKFVNVYQNTGITRENFVNNSVRTK